MLGKMVEVIAVRREKSEFESVQTEGAYRGHVFCGDGGRFSRREAYVIGLNRMPMRFTGRVVALWDRENGEKTLIVGCRNRTFLEPEIRRLMGWAQHGPETLHCLHEKSCGAVVFRRDGNSVQFLIVKNRKGRNWGFPKGHVELGETETETALREIREETGLSVQICPGFRMVSQYALWSHATKQVVFFLAESTSGQLVLQEEEIERARWVPYPAMTGFFRFDNDRRILRSSVSWMRKNGILPPAEKKGEKTGKKNKNTP